jgi:hypothetical protein
MGECKKVSGEGLWKEIGELTIDVSLKVPLHII